MIAILNSLKSGITKTSRILGIVSMLAVATAAHAQWGSGYGYGSGNGYNGGYNRDREVQRLLEHQRAERNRYGDSRRLREHQREELRRLRERRDRREYSPYSYGNGYGNQPWRR